MRSFLVACALLVAAPVAAHASSVITPDSAKAAVRSAMNKAYGKATWKVNLQTTEAISVDGFNVTAIVSGKNARFARPIFRSGTVNMLKGAGAPKGAKRINFSPINFE
jgi:hypothetical protein